MKKNFSFYRYWVAEKLHMVVNFVFGCKRLTLASGFSLEKIDIEHAKSDAEHIGVSLEEYLDDWIKERKSELKETLLHTLEQDGYLTWQETTDYANEDVKITFRMSMLGMKSKSILNDMNYKNPLA